MSLHFRDLIVVSMIMLWAFSGLFPTGEAKAFILGDVNGDTNVDLGWRQVNNARGGLPDASVDAGYGVCYTQLRVLPHDSESSWRVPDRRQAAT